MQYSAIVVASSVYHKTFQYFKFDSAPRAGRVDFHNLEAIMFNESTKKLWGFHPMQEAFFNSLQEEKPNLVPARVTFSSHDHYQVMILGREIERAAKVRGRLYHTGDELPVVGDWVAIELQAGDHSSLPIEAVLPRWSSLRRADSQMGDQTLVANVDIIGLVTSFNQDLNERRLERGLAMIEDSRAKPVVIVNKSDLVSAEMVSDKVAELTARLGVAVLPCSAQTSEGITDLLALLSVGQSVAFLGMSGVGKSTLINAMLGKEVLLTREIREEDSRGRHTTTHRELFLSEKGFWVIDNPGIREFSFSGDEQSLDRTFDDVTTHMKCKFGDCSHRSEPGCGVLAALQTGELSLARWENYQKIKREMEFQAHKSNKAYQSQKRREWAKHSTRVRQILKDKGKK